MSWIRAKSSQIHSLRHSPEDETLEARFVCFGCRGDEEKAKNCKSCGGRGWSSHYTYESVPTAVYAQVRDAESVGASFNKLIKRGEHSTPAKPFAFKKVQ